MTTPEAFLAALDRAGAATGARTEPVVEGTAPTTDETTDRALLLETEHGGLLWHLPGDDEPPSTATPVRVVVFDRATPVLDGLGDALARRFELGHRPHRLRAFTSDTFTRPAADSLDAATLRGWSDDGPALLFVHGTANESHSGFGRVPLEMMTTLSTRYGGRVLALDHPTVSVSPADNVTWLGEALAGLEGRRLTVDVVAHSRGGLVSRLAAEQPERTGGRLDVRRLVLVATPNAGTALAADGRIRDLVDRLTTLLRTTPGGDLVRPLEVVLALVGQLAAGVVEGLDGLAAMDPDGDFLRRVLNTPDDTEPRDYRAVGSDFEPPPGSPWSDVALDAGSDLVFDDVANDLVVPTAGSWHVDGVPGFPVAEPLLFGAVDGVDHSGYWAEPSCTARLLDWLPPAATRE